MAGKRDEVLDGAVPVLLGHGKEVKEKLAELLWR